MPRSHSPSMGGSNPPVIKFDRLASSSWDDVQLTWHGYDRRKSVSHRRGKIFFCFLLSLPTPSPPSSDSVKEIDIYLFLNHFKMTCPPLPSRRGKIFFCLAFQNAIFQRIFLSNVCVCGESVVHGN